MPRQTPAGLRRYSIRLGVPLSPAAQIQSNDDRNEYSRSPLCAATGSYGQSNGMYDSMSIASSMAIVMGGECV